MGFKQVLSIDVAFHLIAFEVLSPTGRREEEHDPVVSKSVRFIFRQRSDTPVFGSIIEVPFRVGGEKHEHLSKLVRQMDSTKSCHLPVLESV